MREFGVRGLYSLHPESALDGLTVIFVGKEGRTVACGLHGCGGVGSHSGEDAPLIVYFWRRDPDREWYPQILR